MRIVTGLILAGFVMLTNLDYQDDVLAAQAYCERVIEWKESQGEYGHPDFNEVGCE